MSRKNFILVLIFLVLALSVGGYYLYTKTKKVEQPPVVAPKENGDFHKAQIIQELVNAKPNEAVKKTETNEKIINSLISAEPQKLSGEEKKDKEEILDSLINLTPQ